MHNKNREREREKKKKSITLPNIAGMQSKIHKSIITHMDGRMDI